MNLVAHCDSITQHVRSKEVQPGAFQDEPIWDVRFTLQSGEEAVGNLTLHFTEPKNYQVGKKYSLTF